MSQSTDLITCLKRELKARGLTYARLAPALGLSEASVKRLFSRRDLSLARLDAICAFAGIAFADLTRGAADDRLLSTLSAAQEQTLVDDPLSFLAATSALDLLTFEQILARYAIEPAELVTAFATLDRIGFLRLLPNNHYRLLIARTFRWLPDGPIQRSFKTHANEFFDSAFDGPEQFMVLLNTRLSTSHAAALIDRLQRLAKEVSEQHIDDAHRSLDDRKPVSLLLAARPWQPGFLRAMERPPEAPARRIRRR